MRSDYGRRHERLLDLTRYPDAAAETLKNEMEVVKLQEEVAKKKAEEDRLKAEAAG